MEKRVCPKCGITYTEHPAISRKDNKTEICPDCGLSEALEEFWENMKIKKEKKRNT